MAAPKFDLNSNDSTICAFDDPVPSGSDVAVVAPERCQEPPHGIEKEVQRILARQPGLQILTLAVHRMEDGVCLEGTLESDRPCPDLEDLLQEIVGVDRVINRLRVRMVDRLAAPLSDCDDTVFV